MKTKYRIRARQSGWYVSQVGQTLDLDPSPESALVVSSRESADSLLVIAAEELDGVLLDVETCEEEA